jgi:predicted DNA-binding transcriptional regulator AlpA
MTAPALPRPATNRSALLTLAEVLAELDVPKSTFFRWKATGKAPRTIKYPNGSLRVRRRDLDAWLAAHEEEAPA